MTSLPSSTPSTDASGGRLVAIDGRTLPLTAASLTADAKGGIVQVKLSQTFHNPHAEPLRVTYALPLPADGAVSGFSFTIGDHRVVGEVDTKQQARARFEDAVLSGRTAAILDQERTSLFTQEVGNVPPRLSVTCEVTIDQKLAWLADGFWEWRFPTVVAPRYLGEPGRVVDAAKVTVDVGDRELPVKLTLGLTIRDRLADGVRPESPSHALHTVRGLSSTEVELADERGVRLDRDVVVRWRAAQAKVGVELDLSRQARGLAGESTYGLLTLVPPGAEGKLAPLSRDLIVLLDTSGSMSGLPLDQARRFTSALVDTLTDHDTLELIEFSNTPRRWKSGAVNATAPNRKAAQQWLSKLRASGGTEMARGIIEALAPLRVEAQRQVILITDGLIGSEHEVLSAISKQLPSGSRVHTIGVGSGVNRSLTQPAARLGRGVELVMGIGEDVEVATSRLLARTTAPLVTDVELGGSALVRPAQARLPDVYAGAPALLSMQLKASGGTLTVRGRTAVGDFEETLEVPAIAPSSGRRAVSTLFAREQVEDLESQRHVDHGVQVDGAVQQLGLDFQISTRLTSWVAISEQLTVDPRLPRRQVTQPHELAYGLSAEGVGLRPAGVPAMAPSAPAEMMELTKSALSNAVPSGARRMETERKRSAPEVFADRDAYSGVAEDDEAEAQSPSPAVVPPPPAKTPVSSVKERAAKQSPAPGGLGSLVDRLSKAISGKGGAVRTVAARLLRQHGTRLDLELVLTAQLDWEPGLDAVVTLADGSTVKVQVNMAFTTSPGVYGSGLVLTLTLTTPHELIDVVRVQLSSAGSPLVLEISGR